MKAYLCQTEVGPQYIHLQADAKKLDPHFEVEDIDLTKEPLLERLNELMRRAHAAQTVPLDASLEEQSDLTPADAAPPAPKPKAKAPATPPHAARNEAQIAWEEFILEIPLSETYRLDALQSLIESRRSEIERGIA